MLNPRRLDVDTVAEGETAEDDVTTITNTRLLDLVSARRLMLTFDRLVRRPIHGGPDAAADTSTPTAKEALQEDELILSGEAPPVEPAGQGMIEPKDTRIRLSDLARRLRELQKEPPPPTPDLSRRETEVIHVVATQIKTEVTIRYERFEPVQGLVLRDKHLAETDRYRLEFLDGSTFRITDKWSGKSTTIWGDPHVDTSDDEGDRNGEFSDLNGSDQYTSFQLEDGTRVTFTAPDAGAIQAVDIFKGSQHIRGIGIGSKEWSEESSLFVTAVDDAAGAASWVPLGDTVLAGGDGNDWFDASGRLVWGKTTAPQPSMHPTGSLEMTIRQRLTQVEVMHTVDRSA